jgi:prepilin-type N-terminal cleavage/methylation domain-containing protein
MKQRGFTIVEILIVIIVMGILLTLAVVNLRSSQVQARDSERAVDVEIFSTILESFYTTTLNGYTSTYPGTTDLTGGLTKPPAADTTSRFLSDRLPTEALYAPNSDSSGTTTSIVLATNATQTESGVRPVPTEGTYVYQPLTQANTLCTSVSAASATGGCVKFNIFYKLERPTTQCPAAKSNVCIYRSKHR